MKLSSLLKPLLLTFSLLTYSLASHVGYRVENGPSGHYIVEVALTLAIPFAYTVIPEYPNEVDALAKAVLSDVQDIIADVWMFAWDGEPSFQFHSAAEKYVTVGAKVVWLKASSGLKKGMLQEICAHVAETLGVRNLRNLATVGHHGGGKRDLRYVRRIGMEEGDAMLERRDGTCPAPNKTRFKDAITGDKLQDFSGQGSCIRP